MSFAVFDARAAAPLSSDEASSRVLSPFREYHQLLLFVLEPVRTRLRTPSFLLGSEEPFSSLGFALSFRRSLRQTQASFETPKGLVQDL